VEESGAQRRRHRYVCHRIELLDRFPVAIGSSEQVCLRVPELRDERLGVPLEEVVGEARRQEQFQLTREGESKADAEQHAADNTATIAHRGQTEGGYVRVDVPLDMLAEDKTHVTDGRMDRLEKVRKAGGGEHRDPIFITDQPIIVDGQKKLTPLNGNNRIAHARQHGDATVPAFVTRKAWEEMEGASQNETRPGVRSETPVPERSTGRLEQISQRLETEAQAAMERIRRRGTFRGARMNTGLPADDLTDLAIWGAAKLAKGTVDFTRWSGEMISDFGEQARPYLAKIYQAAHAHLESPAIERMKGPGTGPFGPVFQGYTGRPAEAIAKLQQEQTGEIPRVWFNPKLERETGDGWIGLAWGNLKGGLAHIIDKHVIQQKDLTLGDLVEMIPDMRILDNDGRSITLESATHKAAVRLGYDSGSRQWLVTAYEKGPSTGGFPFVPGSPQIPPQSGGHPPPGGPGPLPPSSGSSGAPTSSVPPENPGVNRTEPPEAPRESSASTVTFGTGLGGLQPLFAEAKAEGDALRAKRNAALAAAKAAAATPAQKSAGEALRSYYTSERDLWAARVNQALDIVMRKVLPKIQDREAVGIMREFRHKPQELQAFIDGSHPYLQQANGGVGQAMMRLDKLLPVMRSALRMILNPTSREHAADQVMTNIATKSLQEGQAGGWLDSRWQPDEYVPHLINPKGKGELAKLPEPVRRRQGKIGKYFAFGERRQGNHCLRRVVLLVTRQQ
jgi:hypothetical protein